MRAFNGFCTVNRFVAVPIYTLILRHSPSAAEQRKRVDFDSGDRELRIGDVVDVDGRAWRLIDEHVFAADSAPHNRTFAAEPA